MASGGQRGRGVPQEGGARARRWSFGRAVFDEASMELRVNGQPVHLERKPLEVLAYLLQHSGEVVTKDELAENLWPGRILTESVLTRCISLLRQALDDSQRTLLRTVHGFGYRLDVNPRVEASAAPPVPATFSFSPGDTLPRRPRWKLVERLGTGGHGEAWLAHHDKTREFRVFKFAVDERALASLKREITLYRVLHDSLGDTNRFIRILDWNLEEPPYFLEEEYAGGGNLLTWSEELGGLARVPLKTRLELAAQIAEALAAAHSVGVLHKDLKPSNVLINVDRKPGQPGADDSPSVQLCDFGSGGVLDGSRFEALGITRLGFTQTQGADGKAGATPLYLAPEVMAGQPHTVKADIYSLGVILYQMVGGHLNKPLAPGWEFDIQDELLREDIAATAAGDPDRRLTDAAEVASRLRTLEQRRATRALETTALARSARAQQTLTELKRTRILAGAFLGLASIAIAGGIAAYSARNEATAAIATARAINDFLTEGVLRVDPQSERPKTASYESILNRAAGQVSERLGDQPEAAAKVHWLLGRRYHEIGRIDAAVEQYERATALFTEVYGRDAEDTLVVLDRLAWIYSARNQSDQALSIAAEVQQGWEKRMGRQDLAVLLLRARLAVIQASAGLVLESQDELLATLSEVTNAAPASETSRRLINQWLGILRTTDVQKLPDPDVRKLVEAYAKFVLTGYLWVPNSMRPQEAVAFARDASEVFATRLGDQSELPATALIVLGAALANIGQHEEAELALRDAERAYLAYLPSHHFGQGSVSFALGHLRLEQQRPNEAIQLFQSALEKCTEANGCSSMDIHIVRYNLGEALLEDGRETEAVAVLQDTVGALKKLRGESFLGVLKAQISLALALRKQNRLTDASDTLASIDQYIDSLPAPVIQAEYLRARGLVLRSEGQAGRAIGDLFAAHRLYAQELGERHWRTVRLGEELRAAKRTASYSGTSGSAGQARNRVN